MKQLNLETIALVGGSLNIHETRQQLLRGVYLWWGGRIQTTGSLSNAR